VEPVWLGGRNREVDAAILKSLDGLVLTGGADVEPHRYGFDDPGGSCVHVLPERDEAELPIVDFAMERRLPIFAICRGMQLLNVACGGSLIPDLPGHEFDDSLRHGVRIEPDSQLGRILGAATGDVSSSHHQAVDRPGSGLRVVATGTDGIVEAIEWENPEAKPWLVAVQWHPERMEIDEALAGPLYRAFFEAIATRRP
jgi:putative glutamine amidotransferase